jgi:hypothetical protein
VDAGQPADLRSTQASVWPEPAWQEASNVTNCELQSFSSSNLPLCFEYQDLLAFMYMLVLHITKIKITLQYPMTGNLINILFYGIMNSA